MIKSNVLSRVDSDDPIYVLLLTAAQQFLQMIIQLSRL